MIGPGKVEKITIEKITADAQKKPANLILAGNVRYQPEEMIPCYGYDNEAKFYFDVEWALMKVLIKLGVIPTEAIESVDTAELYEEVRGKVSTTLVKAIEDAITKHDVRALVLLIEKIMEEILGEVKAKSLSKWTHFSATSYDIIDTARILIYKQAFWTVTFPSLLKLISNIKIKMLEFSGEVQIGRTHMQHALPITVDFWLATILNRLLDIAEHMVTLEAELRGKFSGAVGAYNAQVALGLERKSQKMFGKTFEELVLGELGLKPSPISTQILPPEPLARFLFEHTLLSAALGQLANDCRILQSSEVGEVFEGFGKDQVGSSTMAHKRNPIAMEGIVGIGIIIKDEFHKVQDALISMNQRDGTGMSVAREFPGIVVLVLHQLKTLNRIIPKISIDQKALKRNFDMNRHLILSEEVYLAMILYGYESDAHEFVNHTLVPISQKSGKHLIDELVNLSLSGNDEKLIKVVRNMPSELIELLRSPERVIGKAMGKSEEVIKKADVLLWSYEKLLKA